ncbi:hypothetical protein OROHE_008325 [Orobanche hederae]
MVERRSEVVGRLKALEEGAAPLIAFLQNPNAYQELRADKQHNLQMLNDRYQLKIAGSRKGVLYHRYEVWAYDAFRPFLECVEKLKHGQPVHVPIYDFKTHRRCSDRFCQAAERIHYVCKCFHSLNIVTSHIDVAVNKEFRVIPGTGEFGDRYFGYRLEVVKHGLTHTHEAFTYTHNILHMPHGHINQESATAKSDSAWFDGGTVLMLL